MANTTCKYCAFSEKDENFIPLEMTPRRSAARVASRDNFRGDVNIAREFLTGFIFETPFWKVFLAPEQSYVGRSMIVLKRHVGSLAELSAEELIDFGVVVKKFEAAAKKGFGATMFNWTCMMNDFFRTPAPDPHVHWHVRPRYNRAVEVSGIRFTDPEFGQHYNRDRMQEVPSDVRKEIIAKFRAGIAKA